MIEVVRARDDRLSDELWRFAVGCPSGSDVVHLRLQSYAQRSRKTTRHKMTITDKWDWMDQRSYHSSIPASEVPVPQDVLNEAWARVGQKAILPEPTPRIAERSWTND